MTVKGEGNVTRETCGHKPKNTVDHQKIDKEKNGSSLELQKDRAPAWF